MTALRRLLRWWHGRRLRLADAQLQAEASGREAPWRVMQGGALQRMTHEESHTDWHGD